MAIKQQYRGGAKKATVLLNNLQPTKITMQVPKIAKNQSEKSMNSTNLTTKIYIKSLPPKLATELIKKYEIPSPWAEVLIESCVIKSKTYQAIREVARKHKIYLSFWQYGDRLQEGLAMFYKAHVHDGKDYSHQIITK